MNTKCHSELEIEFSSKLNFLENEKTKRSSEEFKQLIIETWIGFSTQTINRLTRPYSLNEYELADLNLFFDKKFEIYYTTFHEIEPVIQ